MALHDVIQWQSSSLPFKGQMPVTERWHFIIGWMQVEGRWILGELSQVQSGPWVEIPWKCEMHLQLTFYKYLVTRTIYLKVASYVKNEFLCCWDEEAHGIILLWSHRLEIAPNLPMVPSEQDPSDIYEHRGQAIRGSGSGTFYQQRKFWSILGRFLSIGFLEKFYREIHIAE